MKEKKNRIPAEYERLAAELIHLAQTAKKEPDFRYRLFNLDHDVLESSSEDYPSPDWELLQLDISRYVRRGYDQWAKEARERVRWIKSYEAGDEKAIWELIGKFDDDPSLLEKVADAVWFSDDMVRHLHCKIKRYMSLMAALAKAGRGEAGRNMARYALRATDCTRELVTTKPEQFKAVAEQELRWPVLRSPNPVMSQADPDWERLGLGADFPFKLSPDKRLDVTDAAGQVALKLWFYVHRLRESTLEVLQKHKLTVADLKPEGNKVDLHIQAAHLPDFAPESMVVQKWFAAAQAALISAYPDPNDPAKLNTGIPELNAIVKGDRDRATKGRLRHRISERLEKKFYWIAGLNPDHPVPPSG